MLGDGHQLGDRLEGATEVVLVQAGHDHAAAGAGHPLGHGDDFRPEELDLVDAHHVGVADEQQHLVGGVDDLGGHRGVVVRDDGARAVALGVAGVERGLEQRHALPGDLGAAQPPEQLFRFAGEHAAADNFDPASAAARFVAGIDVRFHAGKVRDGSGVSDGNRAGSVA